MADKLKKCILSSTVNIFLCFLLTSTGYFLWMNHLNEFVSAQISDTATTVFGYLLQAAGIGLYALAVRWREHANRSIISIAVVAYAAFLVPASQSHSLVGTLVFGLAGSLLCGVIAGYYLFDLTVFTHENRRAISFGVGYGAATVVSWLVTFIRGFYTDGAAIVLCVFLAVCVLALSFFTKHAQERTAEPTAQPALPLKRLLMMAGALLVLLGIVNSIGFVFQEGEGLEFSRIAYAAGLVAAGIVSDKNRRYGAICSLAAVIIPFITMALRGEAFSLNVFWSLEYFAFGFYSVYRVMLFSDMAARYGFLFLSGFGLLFGRIGEAVGSGVSLALLQQRTALVVVSAVVFVISVLLFFGLYRALYLPQDSVKKSERQIFNEFAAQHDLSPREREIMKLVLSDKTNKEMAAILFVSESTVKFHIHNLLKKTGTKTRIELISLYDETAQ